ncbi:class I SAM-dependent methyltransferase [Paracoccus pacificus]|uniref:Class I SAM-dependent methyltransferase n=1 Tax=Paracoccus pacificus TaxID=1463598 RepID=A0ABW4R9M7_9RHOB
MGFFDFLGALGYSDADVQRMNRRRRFILKPFKKDIEGARVLDLGAHDGRWAYALAAAGATEVVAIEARPELVAAYADFPESDWKGRVTLRQGDLYDGLDGLERDGERFDVVALYGIYYHVMDHFRLLRQATALGAKLIIIDSEFITAENPMIQLVRERTDNDLNAAPQAEGQETAIIGIPSTAAMERMADALGLGCEWVNWDELPPARRVSVADYYRTTPKRRRTCALRPKGAIPPGLET